MIWLGLMLLIASFWFLGFWPTIVIAGIFIGIALIFKVIKTISNVQTSLEDYKRGQLRFVYRDSNGEVATRKLIRWTESAGYIEGFCLTKNDIRAFHKGSIVSFLDGTDSLLGSSKRRPGFSNVKRQLSNQYSQPSFTGFSSTNYYVEPEPTVIISEQLYVTELITESFSYLCDDPNAELNAQAQDILNLNDEQQYDRPFETDELIET